MDNMSLSDIAAVTRGNDNDGWGQGGAWWIIILFLFVFMGGNGLWGNRTGEFGQYATAASQQEILFGQQFGQINDRLTNIGNGICNLGYEMQGGIGQLGKEVALAQAGTNTTIRQDGNAITLLGQGYYHVTVSATLAPTAAGTVTLTGQKDGVAVIGATASQVVAAAAAPTNLALTFLVRNACGCESSILSFLLTGTAAVVNNMAVAVEKL